MTRETAAKTALVLAAVVFFAGCARRGEASARAKYGANSFYYMALRALKKGGQKEAARLFSKCAAKGRSIAAERAALALQGETPAPIAQNAPQDNFDNDDARALHENVLKKNYGGALAFIDGARAFVESSSDSEKSARTISDMGKACLYAACEKEKMARMFESIAENAEGAARHNARFYAARIYAREKGFESAAAENFRRAAECAQTPEARDNAIWYALNFSLDVSIDCAIDALGEWRASWTDARLFDDFFEKLLQKVLAEKRWDCAQKIRALAEGAASDETSARYAYVCARLRQENLSRGDADERALFERALVSGSEKYYKSLALARLGADEKTAEKVLRSSSSRSPIERDDEVEKFLEGFVAFNLPEEIFPEWKALVVAQKRNIGMDCAARLAEFLEGLSQNGNDDFLSQGLRIAARAANSCDRAFSKKELELLYPRGFKKEIEKSCEKFGMSESAMFALVRSESFFESRAVSAAGAKGLAQLMDSTANDIAKKLKVESYDIFDPATNIEFGAFYLSDLARRLDGSTLAAFFSYNAGISRARRWLKDSRLPPDLFLESLPYAETREYGRKLVSAAAMYSWLYYGGGAVSAARELVGF